MLQTLLVAIIAYPWQLATAQIVNEALCSTAFWTYNRVQQSPCLVYATLMGQCSGGRFNLYSPPYHGANLGGSNLCWCSSVSYATLSACSYCQSDYPMTWPRYITNCTASDVTRGTWPFTIPSGISVPAWAYIDPTQTGNEWSASSAQNVTAQNLPDVTAGASPTTLTNLRPTTSASSSASSTSTSSSEKNSVIGIAVGVPLGFIALALGGIFTILILRSKRKAKARAKDAAAGAGAPPPPSESNVSESHYPMTMGNMYMDSQASPTTMSNMHTSGPPPSYTPHMTYYDPMNPSTYPPPLDHDYPATAQTQHMPESPHQTFGYNPKQSHRPG